MYMAITVAFEISNLTKSKLCKNSTEYERGATEAHRQLELELGKFSKKKRAEKESDRPGHPHFMSAFIALRSVCRRNQIKKVEINQLG